MNASPTDLSVAICADETVATVTIGMFNGCSDPTQCQKYANGSLQIDMCSTCTQVSRNHGKSAKCAEMGCPEHGFSSSSERLGRSECLTRTNNRTDSSLIHGAPIPAAVDLTARAMPHLPKNCLTGGLGRAPVMRKTSNSAGKSDDFEEIDRRADRLGGRCLTHEPEFGKGMHHDARM